MNEVIVYAYDIERVIDGYLAPGLQTEVTARIEALAKYAHKLEMDLEYLLAFCHGLSIVPKDTDEDEDIRTILQKAIGNLFDKRSKT